MNLAKCFLLDSAYHYSGMASIFLLQHLKFFLDLLRKQNTKMYYLNKNNRKNVDIAPQQEKKGCLYLLVIPTKTLQSKV